jgi:FdrA protein
MRLAGRLAAMTGIAKSAVMMGTEANKEVLKESGLLDGTGRDARADDVVVAVSAETAALGQDALAAAVAAFESVDRTVMGTSYSSLGQAIDATPEANIALISVPGQYAAGEARAALSRGLNVMLFSDNVEIQEEIQLKAQAKSHGLLVMGPDCGTAIVNGVPLAFANAVRTGPVGLAGASGTGLQEVSVLLDRAGIGVSQVLGAGGRDTGDAVGGASLLQCIDLLETDPATKVIAMVSKPPSRAVADDVLARASAASKPVVACFLGSSATTVHANVTHVGFLEDVVPAVAAHLGLAWASEPGDFWISPQDYERLLKDQVRRLSKSQRFICGLFSGGTLRDEAELVVHGGLGSGSLNYADDHGSVAQGVLGLKSHRLVDLGADEFTVGRPHPMIDPEIRNRLILDACLEPAIAVILMDVVLGFGSHPDPAGAAADAIREGRARAASQGRDVAFVVSVCGTEADPQNLADSEKQLTQVGAAVLPTNAQAARFAMAVGQRSQSAGRLRCVQPPAAAERVSCEKSFLWGGDLVVINVGLTGFYEDLQNLGVRVAHVAWTPPAGGDRDLAARLSLIM